MCFRSLMLAMLCFLLACGGPAAPVDRLTNTTVEAGCGMCKYGVIGTQGCYWAIQWKGEMAVVQGEVPKDHENHGPEGMCNIKRMAKVSGTVRSGQFYSTQFELLPAQDVPDNPTFTPADKH